MTIPITPGSSGATAPALKAPASHGTGGTFAALFAGLTSAPKASASTAALGVDDRLTSSIKDALDRGTSLDDVIARLASSLAASVANQLGISPDAAREQLTAAFSQALRPTDTGPPLTNAERASSLVSRLRQIADLAARVANGDTGQTIRLIAGQRSDAEQAKAKPAPLTDTMLRDALDALAATASPAIAANAPSTPGTSAPAGDGRTVALTDPALAIAAGGDTPLGRIIARALLAAPDSSPDVTSPSTDASLSQVASASLTLRRAQGDTGAGDTGARADSGRGSGLVHSDAPVVNAGAAGSAAVDAFVNAFASALAREDDASKQRNAPRTIADPGTQPITGAIPLVKDALPIGPPPPAPALPQAQHLDANAVVDQILRGIAVRTTDGSSEVRLRLVPEHLGDVSVKLIVANGTVDASITAHTADAQNALAGAQSQLAKTFADAGLKLQSFTVGLAGGGFADNREHSRQHDASNRANLRRIAGVGSLALDEPDDASLLAVPGFGPPIFSARPLPGALNYLV